MAVHDEGALDVHGIVASLDGRRAVKRHVRADAANPSEAGKRLADALTTGGAAEILEEVRRTQA